MNINQIRNPIPYQLGYTAGYANHNGEGRVVSPYDNPHDDYSWCFGYSDGNAQYWKDESAKFMLEQKEKAFREESEKRKREYSSGWVNKMFPD